MGAGGLLLNANNMQLIKLSCKSKMTIRDTKKLLMLTKAALI